MRSPALSVLVVLFAAAPLPAQGIGVHGRLATSGGYVAPGGIAHPSAGRAAGKGDPLEWTLGGAAAGALAGFILSLPRDSDEEAAVDLRVAGFRLYVPPSGGIGFQVRTSGRSRPLW